MRVFDLSSGVVAWVVHVVFPALCLVEKVSCAVGSEVSRGSD